MEQKLKVLFLTNVPAPYRVLFFNELGKLCDLTVLFQRSRSSERNKKWTAESQNTYKSIQLRGIKTGVDNAFCPGVVKHLKKGYDAIVICGISSPTEILAIEWCKLTGLPYWLEGDGAFAKSGKGFKERLKKHLLTGAELYFSTCTEHDKYTIQYGADPSKVHRYGFTSLLERDIIETPVSKEEKAALRKELGMKEETIILSVGRFIYGKGYDVLLSAAVGLPKSIGIYIVGDTPIKEFLAFCDAHNLTNVHFEGFKQKEALKEYYKAADLFVLPTRSDVWGLVINEAMACGLPIVTTDMCNAGLELIKNGINGYIVPVDSAEALQEAMLRVVAEHEKMGAAALETIKSYTIENMAKQHIDIFKNR